MSLALPEIQRQGKGIASTYDDAWPQLLGTRMPADRHRKHLLDYVNTHEVRQENLMPGIVYTDMHVNTHAAPI